MTRKIKHRIRKPRVLRTPRKIIHSTRKPRVLRTPRKIIHRIRKPRVLQPPRKIIHKVKNPIILQYNEKEILKKEIIKLQATPIKKSEAPIVKNKIKLIKKRIMDSENHLFGRGRTKRKARKAARRSGASRKEARGIGRLAKRNLKSAQLKRKATGGQKTKLFSSKLRTKTHRSLPKKRELRLIKRSNIVRGRGTTNGGKILLQNAVIAPLLPFRSAMEKALRDKGKFSNGMSFPNVVNAFYNNFVSKRNYESSSNLEVSDNYLDSHESAKIYYEDLNADDRNHFGASIGVIVSAIISFFKKMKEKKLANKSANKTEAELGAKTIQVEKILKKEKQDSKPITKEDFKLLKGKDKRELRKLFHNQKEKKAGIFSEIGSILGDVVTETIKKTTSNKKDVEGNRDVRYTNTPENQINKNEGLIKKVIGIVIFSLLVYIIFKKLS